MTRILTILTEGFADWETSLLNAAARSFYGVETQYATPGGRPVTSSGGMVVTPGLAFGPGGAGYFRISFVQPADVLRDAVARLAQVAAGAVV